MRLVHSEIRTRGRKRARYIFQFIFIAVLLGLSPAFADIYRWTDEEGVLHIADDMHKVPEKYRGKVDVIKTGPEDEEPPVEPFPPSPPAGPERRGEGEELYDGRPLSWWKQQFDKINERIEAQEGAYNKKRQFVAVFEGGRRFGQVFEADQIETYKRYKKEIPRDEKNLEELNEELEELRRKAGSAGVPRHIRE
jgi:hypothetical protein